MTRRAAICSVALLALTLSCAVAHREAERADRATKRLEPIVLSEDDALARHVAAVGARLVAAQGLEPEAYRFHVLMTGQPNAFAFPNGFISITMKLLLMLNSDDELAMVLGHEIGHLEARHLVERETRESWIKALLFFPLLPFNVLTGNVYGDAALTATLTSFTREEESEADDLGLDAVRAAGFDVRCSVEFYRSLGRMRELLLLENPDLEIPSGIWATHPGPEERHGRLSNALTGNPADLREQRCSDDLLDLIDGRVPDGPIATLKGADGSTYLPRLGLQFTPGTRPGTQYQNGSLYFGGLGRVGTLTQMPTGQTLEALREKLPSMVGGSKFVSDSSTSADGDSLWVRWSTSRTIEFRMWIWFGDGLYQIAVSTSWRAWIRTSEHLDNLVRHLEPLDPDTIPHEDLPIRLRIHTVAEGETVEALIAQYPDSDVQALELWNGIEPGQPLVPGSRVKVITRSLPTYE